MAFKRPKVGDDYFPHFADEWIGDRSAMLKIESIEGETETPDGEPYGWSITADDGIGYDCVWCQEFCIWCYGL